MTLQGGGAATPNSSRVYFYALHITILVIHILCYWASVLYFIIMLENTKKIENQPFIKWNPTFYRSTATGELDLWRMLNDTDFAYYKLRVSSNSYLQKHFVREFILQRDGHQCLKCLSTEYLSIDHIISVYEVAYYQTIPWRMLNDLTNLQTLCRSCNSQKVRVSFSRYIK